MLADLRRTFLSKHFVVYCVIGLSGVSLDMLLFYALTTRLGLHYEIAHMFGVSLGITNNFTWNALLNFKVRDRLLVRYAQFYAVGMVGMVLGMVLLYVFIEWMTVPVMVAKVLVVFFVTIVQYKLNVGAAMKRADAPSSG
jgi:putative flippase GtrA